METDIALSIPATDISETVELTKNTKGFGWTLKIRSRGEERLDDKMIGRLEDLNSQMMNKFGGSE